jgi:acyl carrier protein
MQKTYYSTRKGYTMEIENLTLEIYTYIKKEMNHSNDFDLATNIVEEGLIDSMAILTLVQFLEQEYGVHIDFEDINPDNFRDVHVIAKFIKKLVG